MFVMKIAFKIHNGINEACGNKQHFSRQVDSGIPDVSRGLQGETLQPFPYHRIDLDRSNISHCILHGDFIWKPIA